MITDEMQMVANLFFWIVVIAGGGVLGFAILVVLFPLYLSWDTKRENHAKFIDELRWLKAEWPRLEDYRAKLANGMPPTFPAFEEAYLSIFSEEFNRIYNIPFPSEQPPKDPAVLMKFRSLILEECRPDDFVYAFLSDYQRAAPHIPKPLPTEQAAVFNTTVGDLFLNGNAEGMRQFRKDTFTFFWEPRGQDDPNRPHHYNSIYTSPFRPLLDVPFPIALSQRTRHTHIIAPTGSGKTNLLEHLIATDLKDGNTVVVIDSQRQLIPKLAELNIPLDQIAYVSPRHDFGINPFDVPIHGTSLYDYEQAVNSATDLLEYIMGELLATEFTEKQKVPFEFALQLMLTIPNANLHVFYYLMKGNDPTPFLPYIERLPYHLQHFFKNEFWDPKSEYTKTRQEIGWRIQSLMRNPTLLRLFSAKRNAFVLDEEIRKRKLILIDTDSVLLQSMTGAFGRIFIAQLLHAAVRRFEGTHPPVYVYVDECAQYLDSRLSIMLETVRKANMGMILAHQNFGHENMAKVLPALDGAYTKIVGGDDKSVLKTMANRMNATYEQLAALPDYHFALQMGKQVYTVSAPENPLKEWPLRSDNIQAEMERRYGLQAQRRREQERRQSSGSRDLIIPDIIDAEYEVLDDDIEPNERL